MVTNKVAVAPQFLQLGRRLFVSKPPTRAAVHGTQLPLPDIINQEEAEEQINKAIAEKARKRQQIEKAVDSQLRNSQLLSGSRILIWKF